MLQKCFICNVSQEKVAILEDTPTLPPFRIQFSCFENVGLDYAGPLLFYNIIL